ncbi:MAG: glycosyltransferase [Gallionella sp.]|nr:glycosyltransferase [Gallionella sp.]MDD4958666.1 glycosyltransferase [Gallionella sp.]
MRNQSPIFLTLVFPVRNQSEQLVALLEEANLLLTKLVIDYEIVVVDNSSDDDSVSILKKLSGKDGLPNLQIYALIKEVDADTAAWVGLENALGDFVAVIDPINDDLGFLAEMLDKAVSGADVVFAHNEQKARQNFAYRSAYSVFNWLYKMLNDIHLAKEAPQYRVLSKRVINFILQHPQPAITYRHLPATGGFAKVNLSYSASPKAAHPKQLGESIDRGMRMLVSTTRVPMRLVTLLSLFGAISNLLYSVYVVAVALFKTDVAPGWVSMSLQQSGMFFLISLVLLVLGEYILNMVSLQNDGPLYHVGQEFTSARMTRREKLNIETVMPQESPFQPKSD